jgi:ADP-heptose:LPS heptosyltransferase
MRADRILIVSLDNLGDLVFASALAPPLRARFPNATLSVWSKAYTADVAALIPGVTEVIAADPFWDKAPGRGKGSFRAFVRAAARVRRGRYDIAILAAAPWRTAAAVAATAIPTRVGLVRRRNRAFLTHPLAPEDIRRPVLAEVARLLEPLGAGGAEALRYRLDAAPIADRRARIMASVEEPIAALHPFASKRNRCVAVDVWIEAARLLDSRGYHPLWIGSPAEMAELRAAGTEPGWRYIDRDTDGSLADSAAALSIAALFVGHDSGPLHIAGAFGVPVVGIFAPGEPLRTFPQGVGPSRMLARESPEGITAQDIVREVDQLPMP